MNEWDGITYCTNQDGRPATISMYQIPDLVFQGTFRGVAYKWVDSLSCCAICLDDYRLVWDHCHVTGLVRGRLCSRCNTQEGFSTGGDAWWEVWRFTAPYLMIGRRRLYGNEIGPFPLDRLLNEPMQTLLPAARDLRDMSRNANAAEAAWALARSLGL